VAVLGSFASAWFGWAQERPPKAWRTPLTLASVGSIVLAAVGGVLTWQHWSDGSIFDQDSTARSFGIVVGIEFAAAGIGAAVLSRPAGRSSRPPGSHWSSGSTWFPCDASGEAGWDPGGMATADRASPAARHGGSDGPGGDRIVTARLELVPLAVDDAEDMVAVLGDERLYTFTGGRPPTLEELRARYARLVVGRSPDGTEQWRNWIVRLRDGRAVGTVQATITAAGRAAEVAWVIAVAWQGQGLASEAARGLVAWLEAGGVQTITAHVHPDHHTSAAVAARAGLAAIGEVHDGERVWRRQTS
jgi:RimJ/RimL family protein N-acetyltransferase